MILSRSARPLTALTASLVAAAVSLGAGGGDFPTPEQLGYAVERSRPKGSSPSVTYLHRINRTRLVITYSPLGGVRSVEQYSPGGALRWRRIYRPGEFIEERFHPEYHRRAIRPATKQRDRVEIEFDRDGKRRSARFLISRTASLQEADSCIPDPPLGWEGLLGETGWLAAILPRAKNGDAYVLGRNITVDESCHGTYPRSDSGASLPTLASDIRHALRTGLSCMNDMGGLARQDAATLLGFLEEDYGTPLEFRCGGPSAPPSRRTSANARARSPEQSGGPAVILNTEEGDSFESDHRESRAPATIMHELLHLLGYRHGTGFDMPYVVGNCCFSEPGPHAEQKREIACQLGGMSTSPGFWTTPMYASMFSRMLALDRREHVAARSAWHSVNLGERLPDDRRNAHALFEAGMMIGTARQGSLSDEYWRTTGYPMAALMMGYAALGAEEDSSSVPAAQRDALEERLNRQVRLRYFDPTHPDSEARVRFAGEMGAMLNAALNGEGQRVIDLWRDFNSAGGARREGCSAMERHERSMVNEVAGAAVLTLLDMDDPEVPFEVWGRFDDPCGDDT